MAKKSNVKPKLKPKIKSAGKSTTKQKRVAKSLIKSKGKVLAKRKVQSKARSKVMVKAKSINKSNVGIKAKALKTKIAVMEAPVSLPRGKVNKDISHLRGAKSSLKSPAPIVKRIVNQLVERRRPIKRPTRVNQFNFMKAPGIEHAFEVGGSVEVFCDHEKSKERIRGWVTGIVVQVDNKMVAVQFRSNVYLTDGWMVPDRILWFPLNSEHMRPVAGKKPVTKDFIPSY